MHLKELKKPCHSESLKPRWRKTFPLDLHLLPLNLLPLTIHMIPIHANHQANLDLEWWCTSLGRVERFSITCGHERHAFFFIYLFLNLISFGKRVSVIGLETLRRPSAWASTSGARSSDSAYISIKMGKLLALRQRRREIYGRENIVSLCQTKQNSAIFFNAP